MSTIAARATSESGPTLHTHAGAFPIPRPAPGAAASAVSEEVRVLMARRRMTTTGLAQVLGVSRPAASNRLAGIKPWTLEDLDVLAAFFGVDANTLLPGLGRRLISTDPATEAYCAPAAQPRLRLVSSNSPERSDQVRERDLRLCPTGGADGEITRQAQVCLHLG